MSSKNLRREADNYISEKFIEVRVYNQLIIQSYYGQVHRGGQMYFNHTIFVVTAYSSPIDVNIPMQFLPSIKQFTRLRKLEISLPTSKIQHINKRQKKQSGMVNREEGEDCIASGICYVFCIFGRIIQGTKISNISFKRN